MLIAVAVPTHAAAQPRAEPSLPGGTPPSLGAAFQALVETVTDVEVEPPEPETWFPVRGTIDFGSYDARFGAWRGSHRHEGQDVFADAGTPLVAIRDGGVVETGDDGGRGNYVAIWSPEVDRTFVYLHMRAPTPHAVGDPVQGGDRVGAVGAPARAGATTFTSRCEWGAALPAGRSTRCRSYAGSRCARGSLPSPWTRCSCATVS